MSLPPQRDCRVTRHGAKAAWISCCSSKSQQWPAWRSRGRQQWSNCLSCDLQAQQRGVKQAAPTQPDPEDPCAANYGDYAMVQSTQITGRKWTKVEQLTPELAGQKVGPG